MGGLDSYREDVRLSKKTQYKVRIFHFIINMQ